MDRVLMAAEFLSRAFELLTAEIVLVTCGVMILRVHGIPVNVLLQELTQPLLGY